MKKIEWNHASLGGKVFEAIEQAILGLSLIHI